MEALPHQQTYLVLEFLRKLLKKVYLLSQFPKKLILHFVPQYQVALFKQVGAVAEILVLDVVEMSQIVDYLYLQVPRDFSAVHVVDERVFLVSGLYIYLFGDKREKGLQK